MSWCYRARRNEDKGYVWYDVVEYYGKHMYTVDGIRPTGETIEELIQDLERMLEDVKNRPILED